MNAARRGSASGGADGRAGERADVRGAWAWARRAEVRGAGVGAEGGSETLPYGFWKG
jgi:hypothetical protein